MAVYDYTAASVTGIERGSISAAGFVGMLFGGLLFGSLGDSLGRRRCLLISLGLNCLASLGSATAWSLESLIVFRILSGIGVGGGIPVLFTLCAEHSPSQKRGKYIAVVASFWMIVRGMGVLGEVLSHPLSLGLHLYSVTCLAYVA